MATTAKSTKLSGFVTSGHDAGLCDIAFTPDGASVLTCGGEGQVLAWNAVATHGATAAQTSSIMDDAAGITCMAVDSTRSQLVTGSFEGNDVKAWDLGGWSLVKCLTSCAGHVNGVAVSASGDMIAVAGSDCDVRLLDVASGKYRNLTGHTRYVKSVVFDPRGELLTSTSADGTMRLWRVDDRSDTERSVVVGAEDFETLDVSHQFVRPAWSPDGERLAVPAVSCIKVFRRGAWALPLKLAAHDADPSLLAWSPDGRYMASAGLDMKLCVWDMTAQPPKVLRTYTHDIHFHGLAFQPTSTASAASAGSDPAQPPVLAAIDADGEFVVLTDAHIPLHGDGAAATAAADAAAATSDNAAAATTSSNHSNGTEHQGNSGDAPANGAHAAGGATSSATPTPTKAKATATGTTGARTAVDEPATTSTTTTKRHHRVAVVSSSDEDEESDEDDGAHRSKAGKPKNRLYRPGERDARANSGAGSSSSNNNNNNISALKRTLAALDDDPTATLEDHLMDVDGADGDADVGVFGADGGGGGVGVPGLVRVQPPFQPNATPMEDTSDDNLATSSLQYLAYNRVGAVLAIESAGVRGIEVVFNDVTTNRAVRFADGYNFVMAALGRNGVALASQSFEDEDDEVAGAPRTIPSTVMYRPFKNWSGRNAQWQHKLPEGEDADVVACGAAFVAVATSSQRVRLLRTSGLEAGSMMLPGPVITMVAQGPLLAIVYALSATDRGVTNGYMLLNVEKGSTVCRGTFCMNPLTRVTWAGFTSYNALVLFDSDSVLHALTPGFGLGWQLSPIAELGGTGQPRLWPIDVQESRMLAVKLPNTRSTPVAVKPLPVLHTCTLHLPMLHTSSGKEASMMEMSMRGTATVAHRKWCADEGIALVGDLAPPTEGMLEDGDSDMDADDASLVEARRVRKEEAKLDKCVLMLINMACRNDRLARALDLAKRLHLLKSVQLAVKIAQHAHHTRLAERIHELFMERQDALLAAEEEGDAARSPTPATPHVARTLALSPREGGAAATHATASHKRRREGDSHRTLAASPDFATGGGAAAAASSSSSSSSSRQHVPAGSAGSNAARRRRKHVVMVGGERRSKVSEDDDDSQRHADAAEEATGLNTPTLQRHTSLVQHRNKRQRTQSGHTPRNPFAKRTAASPQKKKNRHVLDALVRKSPGKAAKKLQLSRSSSFAIKARRKRQMELSAQ